MTSKPSDATTMVLVREHGAELARTLRGLLARRTVNSAKPASIDEWENHWRHFEPDSPAWAQYFARYPDELARLADADAAADKTPPPSPPTGQRSTAYGWAAYLRAHGADLLARAREHHQNPQPLGRVVRTADGRTLRIF